MKRREFIQKCGTCFAIGTGVLTLNRKSNAEPSDQTIDPDEVSRSASKHFNPGKKMCSEAVVMAGSEDLGMKNEILPDIAMGLGGGVGGQGGTCGAITGAALILSLAVAEKEPDRKKKKELAFESIGRLFKNFEKEYGSTDCESLLKLDLTKNQSDEKRKSGEQEKKCTVLVEMASRLMADELKFIQSVEKEQPNSKTKQKT